MALISPDCKPDKNLLSGKHLKFVVIDDKGNELNIFKINGVSIKRDNFKFTLGFNQVRTFTFDYVVDYTIVKDKELIGHNWNEVKIYDETGFLVFDGVIKHNSNLVNTYSQLETHRIEAVGSEYEYTTSYIKGLTTFVNLTSKEILLRVAKSYNNKWNQAFKYPVIPNELDDKWQDALNIDGQHSRLFDMIKDREQATYQYRPNGEMYWFKEKNMSFGNDISTNYYCTIPTIEHPNDTKINRVSFKYKDTRGALISEWIQHPSEKKSIKTMEAIYDIKEISVDGDTSFKKNLGQSGKKDKTYSFNGNQISFTGVEQIGEVKIRYWQKQESGVAQHDDENSIKVETTRRTQTSPIFEQEISNERYSDIRDIYEGTKRYVDFVNRYQYKINFTVTSANVDVDYLTNWYDTKRYKWKDPKYFNFIKDDSYFIVKTKTYELLAGSDCDTDVIPLENFTVDVELESDMSNYWEQEVTRDKNQNTRREQNTINVNIHHDWDLGSCTVKNGEQFTGDNLTTQSVQANGNDDIVKNHIPTTEKIMTEILSTYTPKSKTINCLQGNNAYLRGYVYYNIKLPENVEKSDTEVLYLASGTEQDAKNLMVHVFGAENIQPHTAFDIDVYVNSTKKWYSWTKSPLLYNGSYYIQNLHIKYIGHWIKVPVDARIYNKGTDTLAQTWDVESEWGFTGWNGTHRRHEFYIDPHTLTGSLYPIHKYKTVVEPNGQIKTGLESPNYDEITSLKLNVSELSQKFMHYDNKWYTSLANNPKQLWDDKNCDVHKNHKTPAGVNPKTGQDASANDVNSFIMNHNVL